MVCPFSYRRCRACVGKRVHNLKVKQKIKLNLNGIWRGMRELSPYREQHAWDRRPKMRLDLYLNSTYWCINHSGLIIVNVQRKPPRPNVFGMVVLMISSCMVIMRLAVQGAQGRGVGSDTALVLSLREMMLWGRGHRSYSVNEMPEKRGQRLCMWEGFVPSYFHISFPYPFLFLPSNPLPSPYNGEGGGGPMSRQLRQKEWV